MAVAMNSALRAVSTANSRLAGHGASRGMFSGGHGGRFMMPGFWVTPPAVIPRFREEKDFLPTEEFTIDCRDYAPDTTPCAELVERMENLFKDKGVVRLTNTGLMEVGSMKSYANAIVKKQMVYEGGANPRNAVDQKNPNVFEVGAPHDAWLHYHHEMAYNQFSMKNLAFCSVKAPQGKGDSYLSENVSVTEDLLSTEFGQKLKDKGVCYIRCLTDREAYAGEGWRQNRPVYNHWQQSFGVDTTDEAEAKAHECGLTTEWVTDPLKEESKRYLRTKLVTDAFEYCPDIDRNVLFSSIADHGMWFDTWQGMSNIPLEKRPLSMTFGDGTPFTLDELRQWVHAYDKAGIRVRWQVGDVLAFCNYRYAHGRPAFDLQKWEEREIGVILGEKFQRVGALPNAW